MCQACFAQRLYACDIKTVVAKQLTVLNFNAGTVHAASSRSNTHVLQDMRVVSTCYLCAIMSDSFHHLKGVLIAPARHLACVTIMCTHSV